LLYKYKLLTINNQLTVKLTQTTESQQPVNIIIHLHRTLVMTFSCYGALEIIGAITTIIILHPCRSINVLRNHGMQTVKCVLQCSNINTRLHGSPRKSSFQGALTKIRLECASKFEDVSFRLIQAHSVSA